MGAPACTYATNVTSRLFHDISDEREGRRLSCSSSPASSCMACISTTAHGDVFIHEREGRRCVTPICVVCQCVWSKLLMIDVYVTACIFNVKLFPICTPSSHLQHLWPHGLILSHAVTRRLHAVNRANQFSADAVPYPAAAWPAAGLTLHLSSTSTSFIAGRGTQCIITPTP